MSKNFVILKVWLVYVFFFILFYLFIFFNDFKYQISRAQLFETNDVVS